MPKVSVEQLNRHLEPLAPIYLVSGDEPLLVQEASDTIRNAARKAGFVQREVFHADAQFQWQDMLLSANSLGLFAEKKLLELRLSSTKINDSGRKVLEQYSSSAQQDNVLLLIAPKLDGAAKKTSWFKALDRVAVVVTIWPIPAAQFPRWIERRLRQAGLRADSQAIETLASRVEGNLLAAVQEIEKLKLLCDGDLVDYATMAEVVADSARYNVFGLLDTAMAGRAHHASNTVLGLKSEGTEPAIILWALARELRTLIKIKSATEQGQALAAAAKRNGVFDKRLSIVRASIERLTMTQLELLLRRCVQVDKSIKGLDKSDPWATILDIVLALAGVQVLGSA